MTNEPYEVYPLAIVAPVVGEAVQPFLQRHIDWLLPGKNLAIAARQNVFWKPEAPTFYLDIFDRDHLKKICELLQQHRVRIMMSEFLDESLLWCKLAGLLNIKFYVHSHDYDVSARLQDPTFAIRYQTYREAAGIIAASQNAADRLTKLGLPPEKIHVVPCGIPIPDVSALTRNNAPLRVLAVGQMVDKKAPILVLDAFRRALAECPNMHLDFVGDGVLFEAAVDAAQAFEIADQVTFHGAVENHKVLDLMAAADIFIQHSVKSRNGDEEVLPLAIVEALAYKLPVLATRHSAIGEEVIDGHNGFLVDEFDTAAMAKRLVELAGNPAQRAAFGAAGHQHFLHHYTWDAERAKLIQIMELESLA